MAKKWWPPCSLTLTLHTWHWDTSQRWQSSSVLLLCEADVAHFGQNKSQNYHHHWNHWDELDHSLCAPMDNPTHNSQPNGIHENVTMPWFLQSLAAAASHVFEILSLLCQLSRPQSGAKKRGKVRVHVCEGLGCGIFSQHAGGNVVPGQKYLLPPWFGLETASV